MPRFKILSKEEIKEFDTSPEFNLKEKEQFFVINNKNNEIIDKIKSFDNKVAFILMYGYFTANQKFFIPEKFHASDIAFVTNLLSGKTGIAVDFSSYTDNNFWRHKQIISDICGYTLFTDLDAKLLEDEIGALVKKHMRPRKIFSNFIEVLKVKKIEIPTYNALHVMITKYFDKHEDKILSKLESIITESVKLKLEQLIESDEKEKSESAASDGLDANVESKNPTEKIKNYKITLLKRLNYSTRPGKIKEGLEDLDIIKKLYDGISNIIDDLKIPEAAIRHYATWVSKARVTQLLQFNNKYKRYLYLMLFITYQYYFRQDLFVDFFLQAVQSAKNSVTNLEKTKYFDNKKERNEAIKVSYESSKSLKFLIDEIKKILDSHVLSNDAKVLKLQEVLSTNIDKIYNNNGSKSFDEIVSILELEISTKMQNTTYYDLLSAKSIRLQHKVGSILKFLEFNSNTSNNPLMEAIDHYKNKDGDITKNAPTDFLSVEEKQAVTGTKDLKFNVSLYKILLFIKVADGIKSGDLSLKYSYRYLSIDEYLINKYIWNKDKNELLKKASLENFADFRSVIKILQKALHDGYNQTNNNILSGKNNYIKFDKNGKAIIATPKIEKDDVTDEAISLFPKDEFYPILQVLSDVNKATNFIGAFEHFNIKYAKPKPSNEVFYGCIMGHGFDLGLGKIAKISKGISASSLENTINWYFTLDNLHAANNILARYIHKMSLSSLFQKDASKLHTASDGQKFDLSVDSVDANYSFKYHGKDKGISVYSFRDEKSALFYSTAFSSSEREAAYVLDGLLHNEEINSDIHSTDTHGYTEIIFAATHISEIFFAPRIKNLKNQKLYSFKDKKIKYYKDRNYKILPSEYIDEKLIEDNWDDILRTIASIKLKHSSASQIFKRLSSYARQNPLYKALREFGRIIKSIFILKYYDDLELRQSIEKQLNMVELSHKFAKAVFFGNNQEFRAESREEQEIIVNCRRLIQNAIILWNYLYLSNLLLSAKDRLEQQEIVNAIQNKSIISWKHINFYGEYDFTIILLNQNNFDIEKILKFDVGKVLKGRL